MPKYKGKSIPDNIHLRQDRYFILATYKNVLKECNRVGIGGITTFGTKVTLKMINTIQRRFDELQIRWRVYGIYK